MSEWAQKWSPLMVGLLLPPDTIPEQASAALDVLEKVFLQLEKGNDLQHRIDRIGENIAQFEADAAKLADGHRFVAQFAQAAGDRGIVAGAPRRDGKS